MWTPWTGFSVPVAHKIHWIMQMLVTRAQDCLAPLIDLTTGHCNTSVHSTGPWLAFLPSVQQGRALECGFVVLNGTSIHCHAYQKHTRSL